MARPFYPYEADDPDLDWLISNFLYEKPHFFPVDTGILPLVLIPVPVEHPRVEEKEPGILDQELTPAEKSPGERWARK